MYISFFIDFVYIHYTISAWRASVNLISTAKNQYTGLGNEDVPIFPP